uniref:Uncharacterized protein n=1 Tax=Fagus sylvatica TaxID=28930 RepID=A0A2N9I3H4_FAGSY
MDHVNSSDTLSKDDVRYCPCICFIWVEEEREVVQQVDDCTRPIRCPLFQHGHVWTTAGIVKVQFEELPKGLSDQEDVGNSSNETPSVSGSSRGYGSEKPWVARSYFSIVDVEGLKRIRSQYQIPEDTVLRIPNLDERACSSKFDDVAFYEADFKAGLRFPMQPFMREQLDRLCLSPGQLAPNAWRMAIPYSCVVGFWTLNGRQKNLKLVTGLPTSNREWKDGYIFVCGDNWESLPWEENDDTFVRVRRAWGTPPASGIKHPKLSQEGQNRVLRALHHRDHHYTNFIQPKLLAFHSFGMTTAKLNKDKLKRMMEQKDAVPINLGKKRKGDSAPKPVSEEVPVRPLLIIVGSEGGHGRHQSMHALGGRLGVEALAKDEELKRRAESYRKALDQLKALSEQMETARARAVEEYKSSDACDDNNTNIPRMWKCSAVQLLKVIEEQMGLEGRLQDPAFVKNFGMQWPHDFSTNSSNVQGQQPASHAYTLC